MQIVVVIPVSAQTVYQKPFKRCVLIPDNRKRAAEKLRQNNTIPGFSRSFVQNVLDNPIYMGKIAYGRRKTEKKQGTRNEMHVVEQSDFPVYDGQHEAIVSEEDWYLAQDKRKINSFRREKVNNPDHAHILSGILRCPCCGKGMYGNIAKAHSKDKKTRYYYYCKNTITESGHECSFRLNIDQEELNNAVSRIISAMVRKQKFVEAIQEKIGTAVDTGALEKQAEAMRGQLKQVLGTKTRLERQMDTLDVSDPHYDRKISDLQRRYDEQYVIAAEIEEEIDGVEKQIRCIRQEKISGDNIYRLLLAFDEVYHSATEVERKEFMKAFIERIDLYPEKRKDGCWIKNIVFNFPIPIDGGEVKEFPLESESTVETVVLLSRETNPLTIEVRMEVETGEVKEHPTYKRIQEYVQEKYGFKVHTAYIAEVKRMVGLDMHKAPNAVEQRKHEYHPCPPEKVEAIKDALRHFGLIAE